MWTIREKLQMQLDALDRVSVTLYKKYTELLETKDERELTTSEQETLTYLAERVNIVSSNFVKTYEALQKLPAVTHDCTRPWGE